LRLTFTPPDFTFIAKLRWLYPPYLRRHRISFNVIAEQRFSKSCHRAVTFSFSDRILHTAYVYGSRHADLSSSASLVACYSLGIHSVMSSDFIAAQFGLRFTVSVSSSRSSFRSRIAFFIPITSTVHVMLIHLHLQA
jgi:hypothetical protein